MSRDILKLILSTVMIFVVASDVMAQSTNSSRGKEIEAYYIDPTWSDVSYRTMLIRIDGDKIIAYEDPLTKKFNPCNATYHKMTPQEKSQMKLTDSKGRSYEFYYGDCEYTATIGKLKIYFKGGDYNLEDNSVYEENQVDNKPSIALNLSGSDRMDLKQYLQKNMRIRDCYAAGIWEAEISFIVRADGTSCDWKILKSNHAELEKELMRTVKSIKKWIPAKINGKYVDCHITFPFSLKILN